jgi:hypothetical protein
MHTLAHADILLISNLQAGAKIATRNANRHFEVRVLIQREFLGGAERQRPRHHQLRIRNQQWIFDLIVFVGNCSGTDVSASVRLRTYHALRSERKDLKV